MALTLQVLKVPAGEWVLQNAAGSALGRQIVAIAKHRGVKTINLVRCLRHGDACLPTVSLGISTPVQYPGMHPICSCSAETVLHFCFQISAATWFGQRGHRYHGSMVCEHGVRGLKSITAELQVRNKALHGADLHALGADEVLSTADDDVAGRVQELTGADRRDSS